MTTNPSLKRPLTLLKSVYGSHPSNSSELKNCFYKLKSETFKTTSLNNILSFFVSFITIKSVIGAYNNNIIIIIQFQSFWILHFFHGRPNVLHEDFTMNKYVDISIWRCFQVSFDIFLWRCFYKMSLLCVRACNNVLTTFQQLLIISTYVVGMLQKTDFLNIGKIFYDLWFLWNENQVRFSHIFSSVVCPFDDFES